MSEEHFEKYRRAQPLEELARKQQKARRKAWYTVEDIDWAQAAGAEMAKKLRALPEAQ